MKTASEENRFSWANIGSYIRNNLCPQKRVFKEVNIKPGANVLDFGCGAGNYALAAAKQVGVAGKVYALDKQPVVLKTVHNKADKQGLKNIETILSDYSTRLPDASLDFIFLFDIFHLLDYPEKYLAEFQRVLKSDGQLCVKDHHLKPDDMVMRIALSGQFIINKQGKWVLLFKNILSNAFPRVYTTPG